MAIDFNGDREIRLLSVNVGQPRQIGFHRGHPVVSAIFKEPVEVEAISLDWLNLDGDRQADPKHHGGRDKAVYAYSADHFPSWSAELGEDPPFVPASFGENLTVDGWNEDTVQIGDIWSWGEAQLQVVQPRIPCYKLGIRSGRPQILKRFIETGRTGWYLRVLQPGTASVAGPIHLAERDPAGVTVRDAHLARMPGERLVGEMERVAAVPALAEGWREMILELIEREVVGQGLYRGIGRDEQRPID
ncbi:MAG: MOSC domain-containing protein [Thermomicrobiales bacterium]